MLPSQDRRLVIVSNRVAIPRRNAPAAGGLAVGVLGALRDHGGVWFGWNGQLTASEASDPEIVSRGNINYATISLNETDFEQYYNGYSNKVLWPVCHYLLDFIQYDSADFEGYKRVNSLFARKLASILRPDDLVWVHDYHLIPKIARIKGFTFIPGQHPVVIHVAELCLVFFIYHPGSFYMKYGSVQGG